MTTCWKRFVFIAMTIAVAGGSSSGTAAEIPVGECKATYVKRVTLAVDRPGLIAFVPEEGAQVRAADVAVQLRNDVPKANLAVALARAGNDAPIQVEQKMMESAKLEYESSLEANRQSGKERLAYPLTHIARLKLAFEASMYKVEAARQEKLIATAYVEQSRIELETYRTQAPFSGAVTQVFKQVGEAVQQGEPIVELVNTDQLRIEGFVTLQDAVLIRPGMPVKVQFEIPAEGGGPPTLSDVQGQLGYVDVSVHTLSNRVRIWAVIDNSNRRFLEGLPVTMFVVRADLPSRE